MALRVFPIAYCDGQTVRPRSHFPLSPEGAGSQSCHRHDNGALWRAPGVIQCDFGIAVLKSNSSAHKRRGRSRDEYATAGCDEKRCHKGDIEVDVQRC